MSATSELIQILNKCFFVTYIVMGHGQMAIKFLSISPISKGKKGYQITISVVSGRDFLKFSNDLL